MERRCCESIAGPVGPTGDGIQGEIGANGSVGDTGPTGDEGMKGTDSVPTAVPIATIILADLSTYTAVSTTSSGDEAIQWNTTDLVHSNNGNNNQQTTSTSLSVL
jgi:hypothetical protein